ncbi:MAG TPA: glycosyltransferase family 87 protein [Candidatus Binataceae bacterium]|nr:glycosyltransferase family 87 protein [Candidatus Binataceae bacterium]
MDDNIAKARSRFWQIVNRPEAAALAIVVAIIWAYRAIWIERPLDIIRLDFSCYYTWAIAARRHINAYQNDLTLLGLHNGAIIGPVTRSNYPPTFLLLSEPLSHFAPTNAHWIWIIMSVALLIAATVILLADDLPPYLIAIAVSLSFLYSPTYVHFEFGQAQILIMFLLILVLRELERDREITAGLILAFAGLLKGYPLFMALYFLCDHRWRALAAMAVAVMFGFMLTVVILGPWSLGFFARLPRAITAGAGVPMLPIVSIAGTIWRWFGYFVSPANAKSRFALLIHFIATALDLCIFGWVVIVTLRLRARGIDPRSAFGLLIPTMVLLIPGAWPHYMVLLLIPFGQLAIAAYRGEAPRLAIAFGIAAFVVAELAYSGGFVIFDAGHPVLGNVVMEGLFVSTILSWGAAYVLAADLLSRRASPGVRDRSAAPRQAQPQPYAAETR